MSSPPGCPRQVKTDHGAAIHFLTSLSLTLAGVEAGTDRVLIMEAWAEIRRLYFAEGWGIKRICRERGFARNTVRSAVRSETPPAYRRPVSTSKLDSFRDRIEELLASDDVRKAYLGED